MSENKAVLYGKMAQVMGQLERIKETGVHNNQRWTYATSEDVKDAVRGALSDAGLALLVNLDEYQIVELQKGILVRGRMSFTLCCSETGETVTTSLWGEAADQQAVSDKAFYKLYTSLEKYWLKTTFLISSGDEFDSDADNTIDAKPKAKPAPPLKSLKPLNGEVSAKKKAWDDFLAKARVELDLPEEDVIAILSELKFSGFTPEEADKPFELLRQQMEDGVTTEAARVALDKR